MNHPNHKRHPDVKKLRHKAKLACLAVHALAAKEVEILGINFTALTPVIEVAYCPGTHRLQGVAVGQSRQSEGELCIKKTAHLNGCQIVWSEAV